MHSYGTQALRRRPPQNTHKYRGPILLYELTIAINLYTFAAVRFCLRRELRKIHSCQIFFPTACRDEHAARTLYIFPETIKTFVFFNNSTTYECGKNEFLKRQ